MNVIEVGAGLVFRKGKLLITQRRPQDHLGGLWEFPGGKREAAESFEDCLVRELREELGIEAEIGEEAARARHTYDFGEIELIALFVKSYTGEPKDRKSVV